MKDRIAFAIAGWFGCGYMPAARGDRKSVV
jgi:hypothetical protein